MQPPTSWRSARVSGTRKLQGYTRLCTSPSCARANSSATGRKVKAGERTTHNHARDTKMYSSSEQTTNDLERVILYTGKCRNLCHQSLGSSTPTGPIENWHSLSASVGESNTWQTRLSPRAFRSRNLQKVHGSHTRDVNVCGCEE